MSKASAQLNLQRDADKHDEKALKRGLDAIKGVSSVSISGDRVTVDYDTTAVNQEMLVSEAKKLGYAATLSEADITIL